MGMVERFRIVFMLAVVVLVALVPVMLGVLDIGIAIYMAIQCLIVAVLITRWIEWANDEDQKENTGGT